MTIDNFKEQLYSRLKEIEDILETDVPDWWNPHDFGSGYITGVSNTLKKEVEWLSNLIHSLEQT